MPDNTLFAPVLGLDEIVRETDRLRAAGQRIILANGCFDLIHVGHLRYLAAAKDLGGTLVVAINSDKQARVLKGDGRPFVCEDERAEVICGLKSVDMVTIFDEPTVENVIRAIRPDLHAKGTDYTEESVPERAVVLECGGTVVIVGDPKNHSSSGLVESVTSNHP